MTSVMDEGMRISHW